MTIASAKSPGRAEPNRHQFTSAIVYHKFVTQLHLRHHDGARTTLERPTRAGDPQRRSREREHPLGRRPVALE